MITCLQIHNDYLIPGGETKSTNLIGNLLESKGIRVIRYYKNNEEIEQTGFFGKLKLGAQSIYNTRTVSEIQEIICKNNIDFALIHNTSPIVSNSIYAVLRRNKIRIFKYLQNYNLLCLNGAIDKDEKCERCKRCTLVGVKNKCYKGSFVYSTQKYFSKLMIENLYLSGITGFIAISEFIKKVHAEYGIPEDKIHVLYHFCDNIPETVKYESGERYYVYMGRLSSEKGIFTLVKAFEQMPDQTLKIMGNGELESEIKNYLNLHCIKNVQLLGFKKGKEKDDVVRDAVALIAPSEWDEPFGRIVIEAYQWGTPVIASDRGGLKELVVNEETGYKFSSGSVEELISRIKDIEQLTPWAYFEMRDKCFRIVKERFSKNGYVDKFLNIVNMKG